jgi:TadE-like protein
MTRHIRTRFRNERGTALAELALVLPLLLVLLLGMVDLGKAFNEWIDETHLANEGARLASVNYCPDPSNAPGTGSGDCGWSAKGCPVSGQTACIAWYVDQHADVAELPRAAACPSAPAACPGRSSDSYAPAQNAANVCISYPLGTANPGDPVQVTVQVNYQWLGYLFKRLGPRFASTPMSGKATMRLEAPLFSGQTATRTCFPGGSAGT